MFISFFLQNIFTAFHFLIVDRLQRGFYEHCVDPLVGVDPHKENYSFIFAPFAFSLLLSPLPLSIWIPFVPRPGAAITL